jgi:transcriptional regulator with XRE-family HTH domain
MKSSAIAEAEFESLPAALRAKGWTQNELARRLGISKAHVSNMMSGRVTPGKKLALKISRLLDVSLHALIEG